VIRILDILLQKKAKIDFSQLKRDKSVLQDSLTCNAFAEVSGRRTGLEDNPREDFHMVLLTVLRPFFAIFR
jgi:hypothetical protein